MTLLVICISCLYWVSNPSCI